MKKAISHIALEMFSVVFGILIALVINDWQQKQQDQKFVDSILTSITKEVEENTGDLEAIIEKHETAIDTIDRYEGGGLYIGRLITKMGGLSGTSIKNTAWRSFLNSNIQLVDYELISLLTDIDDNKQLMKTQMDGLVRFVTENMGDASEEKRRVFRTLMGSYLNSEKQALKYHQKFLEVRK